MTEHMWTKPKNKSELEEELEEVNKELKKLQYKRESIMLQLAKS